MHWRKLGMVLDVTQHPREWMHSHAMTPFAEFLRDDIYRVYFSGRDGQNRSLVGYADIDVVRAEVLDVAERPVLGLGELGCFDDNGVTPSWIVNHDGRKYLYYIGWNPRSTVRMKLFGGLAISDDSGRTFARHARVPILGPIHEEPFMNTAPCVIKEGALWRLWYVCSVGWLDPDTPKYHIRYAESDDGIHWRREGVVCIDFLPGEQALARPCVLKDGSLYRMWYSYKGAHYRIGYAESADGIRWQRLDDRAGIDVSANGWDSEMIEYAFVFRHKGRMVMFYNGNGYGSGGLGLAVAETR